MTVYCLEEQCLSGVVDPTADSGLPLFAERLGCAREVGKLDRLKSTKSEHLSSKEQSSKQLIVPNTAAEYPLFVGDLNLYERLRNWMVPRCELWEEPKAAA